MSALRSGFAASCALLVCAGVLGAQSSSADKPATKSAAEQAPALGPDDARSSIKHAVQFLLDKQNPDGSWGDPLPSSLFELNYSKASFYAWQMAGDALCCMALMVVDETKDRRAALEKAMHWMVTMPVPKRGSDWDVDSTWTSLVGFNTLVMAAQDARFAGGDWPKQIKDQALRYYGYLAQTQDPLGGWGYYEGPVISHRPTWSTSFATACVIPALLDAQALGWPIDDKLCQRAVEYIDRCALPNGAFSYDLTPIPRAITGEGINEVKGSLGRIQVCNWALHRAGAARVDDAHLRKGLEQFFEDHAFLDMAYQRPIPHEAYYRNAGYFYFFGHYHAARAIEELPEAERESFHRRLRAEIVKTQKLDGSSIDFPGSFYNYTAGTSFAILGLELGLHPERFPHPKAAEQKPAESKPK